MPSAHWSTYVDKVDAAIARAAHWVQSRVTEQGFRGCEHHIQAHYKAPYCLSRLGKVTDAARVMRHVLARFHDDGTFQRNVMPSGSAHGNGQYTNAWLAAGAFQLGLHDVAERALQVIERSIDARVGGVPSVLHAPRDAVTYDAGTVSRCIESLLNAGRVEHAVRLGLFLKKMFDEQPTDARHVTWMRDPAGRLYTPEDPRQRQVLAMLEVGAPRQCYWFLGFSVRSFARLYRIDGWSGWVDSAERILGWLERSHADRTANITNAKLGWAAAEMYAVTGDAVWKDYACRIIDWLVTEQTPSGIWVRPESGSEAAQSDPVSLDVVTERAYYLQEMLRALVLRDAA